MNALIKFITEEWYFFLPMLALSLISAALVVWRWLLNLNARTNLENFLPVFQEKLQKDGVESALKYCRAQNGVIPRKLYAAGLETSRGGLAAMKRAMANAIELEILPDLNFLLAPILAIAKVATMVGLLLTVFSMINTFNAISEANKAGGNPQAVGAQSGAIGLALFGTAGGLMIAIPLVFAHVLFKARVSRFETELKGAAQRLIMLFQALKPRQGGDLKGGASKKE
ncbi:MAG TPA: MotA/TolQ/ExbB proton channel family protein [Gemmataceae bacterium]|jgi:biopolymer transport protein ExbB|nr:MotA/TolQ/ExbB proton channel family protein [Gemmataceae bacterium]